MDKGFLPLRTGCYWSNIGALAMNVRVVYQLRRQGIEICTSGKTDVLLCSLSVTGAYQYLGKILILLQQHPSSEGFRKDEKASGVRTRVVQNQSLNMSLLGDNVAAVT